MKQAWLTAIIQRPWLTLIVSLALVVAASLGAANLVFKGDYKIFFEENNPQLMAFEKIQDEFNETSVATIIIAPHSGDAFDQPTLELVHQITEQAWQIPHSTRVDSLSNYQHTMAEEDDLLVEALIYDDTVLDQKHRNFIREVVMNEPNLYNSMISKEGDVAIISITVQLPGIDRTKEIQTTADAVINLSKTFKDAGAKADFYHGGIVIMNNAFASEAQKDASTLVPAMFIGVLVMLAIMLRSITGTLATMLIIMTSVVATLGLAGWLGFFLSTATVNVPTIVMTLAVADCVHIIGSTLYYMRQGKSKNEALDIALKLNLMPIFITSITTAIGFLTMNFSTVPILADLGNMTAMGVMIAFVLSITLLPALIRIFPMRVKQQAEQGTKLTSLADWVIKHHKKLLPISVVTMAVLTSFITLNEVNDEATKYFDKSTAFRQSADFLEESVGGMSTVDLALYTGEASGINKPAFIADVAKLSDWLMTQPEVTHVSTLSNTFKRLNKNMHGDEQSWYKLPTDNELAAQYLLMYEMSLPYGLDLSNQINIDKSALRVVVSLKNLGSKEMVAFEKRILDWIATNTPKLNVEAASPSLMFAYIGEHNMNSMLKSLPTALFLISILLFFALRSARLGMISLVPNILPAAIGFGIWGLYSGEINLGLAVVASMSLGIIVDDTVHFLSKYKFAREEGKDAADSVRYSFNSVGRALIVTTFVLTVGFSILAMSSFRLNSDLGLLTSIILVVALIVDFLFLPAFLMVFDRDKKQKGTHNEQLATQ